ncbi:MAG: signal peptidase I [Verrucomicrobiota bacterium]
MTKKTTYYFVFGLFCSALIIAILYSFSIREMHQGTSSMEPTIKQGEVIVVNRSAYLLSSPRRWDVIIFSAPIGKGQEWCSRIVGLPGEVVDFTSGGLLINGASLDVPKHIKTQIYKKPERFNSIPLFGYSLPEVRFPYKIPKGSYFTLGDNVEHSCDGRYWGALDCSKILGKVSKK